MKKYLKKQAGTLLAVSMVLAGGSVYADTNSQAEVTSAPVISTVSSSYSLMVNDKVLSTSGIMKNGHIMVPLREVSEALGFQVIWHQDQQNAEVLLPNSPIWTVVLPDMDQYAYNKMNVSLGAAPIKMSGRLYVPASFFEEILRAQVVSNNNQVSFSLQNEDVKMVTALGVITSINIDGQYKSVQMNGTGIDGILLNIDEETIIHDASGKQIDVSELALGMKIDVKHSLAMTMSLPGQTYAYEINVLEAAEDKDLLGTSGTIDEVVKDDEEPMSIVVNGVGMSEGSQERVVLRLNADTILVDLEGNDVSTDVLTQGAKVLAYYGPMLTKSLPPIGQAWKIVYLGN